MKFEENNSRVKYTECPFCGYDKSENWFASSTWYCPKCERSNIFPDVVNELNGDVSKRTFLKEVDERPEEDVKKEEKVYYKNGTLKTIFNTKNNMLHGLIEFYYENSKLKASINFINGKMEGEAVEYYESGEKRTVNGYKEDLRDGHFEEYYESGQLQTSGNFREDKHNKQAFNFLNIFFYG